MRIHSWLLETQHHSCIALAGIDLIKAIKTYNGRAVDARVHGNVQNDVENRGYEGDSVAGEDVVLFVFTEIAGGGVPGDISRRTNLLVDVIHT